MKKICLIFLVSLLFYGNSYGNECSASCKIADAPAPTLTEYLTNLDEMIHNISEAVSTWKKDQKKTTWDSQVTREGFKIKNRVMEAFNKILSFGEYYGSFDYYVALPITQEVPKVVKRDYEKIKSYTQRLSSMLERYEKRGYWKILAKTPCNAVSYCNYPQNISTTDLLTDLIKNNQKILHLITQSLTGKGEVEVDLTLTAGDFQSQMLRYYNKDTLTGCSQCKWEFWYNIRERIWSISLKTGSYKAGIQTWKDAWSLLRWQKPQWEKKEIEERILDEYLSSQGIISWQANVITSNLGRYENSWLSSSNPLLNTKRYLQDTGEGEVKSFEQAVLEKLDDENKVPIVAITQTDLQIQNSSSIQKSISSLFEDQKPYAFTQDVASMQLQWRLLRMHYSLTRSINMLGWASEKATKVCNKQGTGLGICDYSN